MKSLELTLTVSIVIWFWNLGPIQIGRHWARMDQNETRLDFIKIIMNSLGSLICWIVPIHHNIKANVFGILNFNRMHALEDTLIRIWKWNMRANNTWLNSHFVGMSFLSLIPENEFLPICCVIRWYWHEGSFCSRS